MRTELQRQITITTIHYSTVEVAKGKVNVIECEPVKVIGKVPEKDLHKHLPIDKRLITNTLITNTYYESFLYTMPLETFVQYATRKDVNE